MVHDLETGVLTCPEHNIPLISHEGRKWCKLCENQVHQSIEIIRKWIASCQWVIAMLIPLGIIAATGILPVDRNIDLPHQPHTFWLYLQPLTLFLCMWLSVLLGHGILRMASMIRQITCWILPWFDPLHALIDMALLSTSFTLMFLGLQYGFGQILPQVLDQADTFIAWLCYRFPFVVIAVVFLMLTFQRFRWITRYTLLPEDEKSPWYVLLYVALTGVLFFILQQWMVSLVYRGIPESDFIAVCGLATFCCIVYAVSAGLLNIIRTRYRKTHGSVKSYPVRLAIVAPSGAGKTIFVVRAYELMQEKFINPLFKLRVTSGSEDYARPLLDKIHAGEWPGGTTRIDTMPFSVYYGVREIVRFNWLDLPGGAFTNTETAYRELREEFDRYLPTCDAIIYLFGAKRLIEGYGTRSIPDLNIYSDITLDLFKHLSDNVGAGARAIPLAVVVTQSCRVEPELAKIGTRKAWGIPQEATVRDVKGRMNALLQEQVVDSWRKWAAEAGLPRPKAKLYWTSAIVYTGEDNTQFLQEQKVLQDENCVEPILWITAQSMRSKLGLLDISGAQRAQVIETILQLEAQATSSSKDRNGVATVLSEVSSK